MLYTSGLKLMRCGSPNIYMRARPYVSSNKNLRWDEWLNAVNNLLANLVAIHTDAGPNSSRPTPGTQRLHRCGDDASCQPAPSSMYCRHGPITRQAALRSAEHFVSMHLRGIRHRRTRRPYGQGRQPPDLR